MGLDNAKMFIWKYHKQWDWTMLGCIQENTIKWDWTMLGCLYEIQWTMGLDNARMFIRNTMNNGIGQC